MSEKNQTDEHLGGVKGPPGRSGFVMENTSPPVKQPRNNFGVEFRTGATNEDSLRKAQEALEKEASKTPEERAKESRDTYAGILEGITLGGSEYSETIPIEANGELSVRQQGDEQASSAVVYGDLQSSEDLYQFMHKVSEEHPQLSVSFEVDPNRKWIRYRVIKNQKLEKARSKNTP